MSTETDPVPPQELFQHRDDYLAVAQRMFGLLTDLTDLSPDHRVLDVGCGAGRLATPLARYLGPGGSYEGFDNNAERIAWCREHIGALHPGLGFTFADLYNGQYNPSATIQPKDFMFPYEDGGFDLVFLMSVFTHMMPPDVEHYMGEIARVLKRGGQALITWFILNEESEHLIAEQRDQRSDPAENAHKALFSHDFGVCRSTNRRVPECVVAYYDDHVRGLYRENGLEIEEPVHYGSWAGRLDTLHNQDVVVARLS